MTSMVWIMHTKSLTMIKSNINAHRTMINNKTTIGDLICMTKKMLDDAGINTKCKDVSIWHEVYKDCVFNETMFYSNREVFAVSLVKEPYISVSLASKTDKHVVFELDTVTTYPHDEIELKKSVENLIENYKKCVDAYTCMKEDIDKANATIAEMFKTDARQLIKYENDIERELNCQLQNLMKIYEL